MIQLSSNMYIGHIKCADMIVYVSECVRVVLSTQLFTWRPSDLVSTGETGSIIGYLRKQLLNCCLCLSMGKVQVGLWVPMPSP